MVKQPIKDGRGDHSIPKEFLPIGEALVGGDDRGALLIAIGDELEEEIGFPAVHGQVAGFIDDHQAGAQISLPLALGFLEFTDQGVHRGEVDLESMAARLDRQGDGQMGLAHPWRTQEDDVFVLGQEGQIEEIHDGLLVQMGMEGEVILLDGFGKGQAGDLHGGLDSSLLLGRNFFFEQMVQKGEIGDLAILGAGGDVVEHFGGPDQLEPLEVVLEAFIGQLFHEAPPRAY